MPAKVQHLFACCMLDFFLLAKMLLLLKHLKLHEWLAAISCAAREMFEHTHWFLAPAARPRGRSELDRAEILLLHYENERKEQQAAVTLFDVDLEVFAQSVRCFGSKNPLSMGQTIGHFPPIRHAFGAWI